MQSCCSLLPPVCGEGKNKPLSDREEAVCKGVVEKAGERECIQLLGVVLASSPGSVCFLQSLENQEGMSSTCLPFLF